MMLSIALGCFELRGRRCTREHLKLRARLVEHVHTVHAICCDAGEAVWAVGEEGGACGGCGEAGDTSSNASRMGIAPGGSNVWWYV